MRCDGVYQPSTCTDEAEYMCEFEGSTRLVVMLCPWHTDEAIELELFSGIWRFDGSDMTDYP